MKVNTKGTESPFEKGFEKFHFNSGKNIWWQIHSTKAFHFRYIPLCKNAEAVLVFYISKDFNSIGYVLQGAVSNFCKSVSGANLSEQFFTHIILKQASQFCLQENLSFRSFYRQAFYK